MNWAAMLAGVGLLIVLGDVIASIFVGTGDPWGLVMIVGAGITVVFGIIAHMIDTSGDDGWMGRYRNG